MIIVDKEFESLIPPLSEDEFKQLEENILRDGIRDPLCLWRNEAGEDILLDGHNRFKIAAHHGGIPFKTEYILLKNREVAKQWIIRNQFGRRNLNNFQRSELALKLKPMIAEEAKRRQSEGGNSREVGRLTSAQPSKTNQELGSIAKVGKDTIRKVEHVLDKGSDETKEAARSGKISVNEAYKRTVKENEPQKPDIPTIEEEHEAFVEKKKTAPVLTMDEIEIDKTNQRIIALDTITAISKAAEKMENFMLDQKTNSIEKVRSRTEALTKEEKQDMIQRMQSIRNFTNGIINALKGE